MKVMIVAVGRVRGNLAGAVQEYERRAGHYWKFEVAEVDAGAQGRNPEPDRVRDAEAARILSRIPDGFDAVALTRTGKTMASRRLAAYLEELGLHARPGVAFVIGGAFGIAPSLLARASRTLALSAMTLPHEMARLVMAEQLYRAGTIVRNEPYHKGVR